MKTIEILNLIREGCSSQEEVARKIGKRATQAKVSSWLNGRTSIPHDVSARLRVLLPGVLVKRARKANSDVLLSTMIDAMDALSTQVETLSKDNENLRSAIAEIRLQQAEIRTEVRGLKGS